MADNIENVWLYKPGERINFLLAEWAGEKLVTFQGSFSDEHSAKIAFIRFAKCQSQGCNLIYDASWFPCGNTYIMKGKAARGVFA